ncbi:MAG: DEAD/DEAH box helicase [Actinobacteria bacterium]|nr:DEAD/DEAH box helicase [Actinomycetota bacterium]
MAIDRSAKAVLADYEALSAAVGHMQALPLGLAGAAQAQIVGIRREAALVQLQQVPASRLGETAKGLRLGALERAGYKTIAQILAAGEGRLRMVDGVGETTARQVTAAARQVQVATEQATRLHFDVVGRRPDQTQLLAMLRRYDLATRAGDQFEAWIAWLHETVGPVAAAAAPSANSWLKRAVMRKGAKASAAEALARLDGLLADPAVHGFRGHLVASRQEVERPRSDDEVWTDYEQNAAQLLGILGEVSEGSDSPANRGQLPAEIVQRVSEQSLDLAFLRAGLRGYQAFGAKYALVQQRTILGDEMGLGKTVEALAVMCHLRASGKDRALVVCPASVVANWRSEIRRHTELRAHVLHGADRVSARRAWERHGGVAITTFDALRRLEPLTSTGADGDGASITQIEPSLPLLVVDEAHYVKNPSTQRSQAVARWASTAERALFLTGTPMENRVEEFRALLDHLQPALAQTVSATAGVAGPAAFQAAVAPAYLRRNQIDVLDELPELIPSLDWVDPTELDLVAYRAAVSAGAFMTMRRAAYFAARSESGTTPDSAERSGKVARLVDIIGEASEEGLKVVVFSYFREVLDIVTGAASLVCPGAVYGPLSGATPAAERQRMVDSLAAHVGPAVLTAQIEAGGVGLNIQAASVVILCEPQWKPTTEAQAIARCHRMGQVRRVQVHRLLLADSVDQRMLTVLAGKQHVIEQYVSGSAIKDASPDSIDVSDLEVVDRVVSEAEAERLIVASERRRLGIDGPSPVTPTG